jgi:hypothetical protein
MLASIRRLGGPAAKNPASADAILARASLPDGNENESVVRRRIIDIARRSIRQPAPG